MSNPHNNVQFSKRAGKFLSNCLHSPKKPDEILENTCMLLAGWEVRIVKNCDRGHAVVDDDVVAIVVVVAVIVSTNHYVH